jgi:positive regulator of sigma E activity
MCSRTLLRAATLAYGLPLAAMIGMVVTGSVIAGPLEEAIAVLLAAAGLACGIGISRWRLARSCAKNLIPKVHAVRPQDSANREIRDA